VQLVRAHARLAGRHQLSRQHPLVQRDMRPLHDGADRDCEGLPAVLALVNAGPGALALQLGDAVADGPAARADGAVRPEQAFEVLTRGVLVVEDRVGDVELAANDA
jgi:hypothetical protein